MATAGAVASFVLVFIAIALGVSAIVVSTAAKTEGPVGPTGPDGPIFEGILPIAKGGTNAGVALTNNKFMISMNGQIVEGEDKENPVFETLILTDPSNQLKLGDTTLTAPNPPAARTVTIPSDVGQNSSFVMNQGTSTINGQKTFSSQTLFGSGSNQVSFPGVTHSIVLNAPEPSSNRVYTFDDIGTNGSFVMTQGAQLINGSKSFSNQLTLSAGTNQIKFSNASDIVLSAPSPASSLVYTIPDVSSDASFVMNQGLQNISGVKTFLDRPIFATGTTFLNASVPSYLPSILDFYEEYKPPGGTIQFKSALSGIDISIATPMRIVRIGKTVTLTLYSTENFSVTGVPTRLVCVGAIPQRFRNNGTIFEFTNLGSSIAGTRYVGLVVIGAGTIDLWPDQTNLSNLWAASANSFKGSSFSYNIDF